MGYKEEYRAYIEALQADHGRNAAVAEMEDAMVKQQKEKAAAERTENYFREYSRQMTRQRQDLELQAYEDIQELERRIGAPPEQL